MDSGTSENLSREAGSTGDQELWEELRQGQQSAYAFIYQRHFSHLYAYGLKICPEKEVVKDALHDLFAHLWKHHGKLGSTTSIQFYLMKALKRKLLDHFTYHTRYAEIPSWDQDAFGATPSEEHTLINLQFTQEQKERVLRALEKLTDRQKEAVILKFYENLPNERIAERMSISVEGVYNLMAKALSRLRKNIRKAHLLFTLSQLLLLPAFPMA
ncbi:RNA polymerase sigma factor [Rufibacter immobilis]|uniref:RNA polymerase sigma factor n=1 Tax=Rufibacter immobilis TaxID=1348778 RepID=UPI0035E68BA2